MSVSGINNNNQSYSISQANNDLNTGKSKSQSSAALTQNEAAGKNSETGESKLFKNVSEYSSYLFNTYKYFGRSASVEGVPTSVSVSGAFLSKCVNDPEKAKYLESNLDAISDSISYVKNHALGTLVSASYNIDADGNISATTISTNDPDGKIARENAKKAAKEKKEIEAKNEERIQEERIEEQKKQEEMLSNMRDTPLDLFA